MKKMSKRDAKGCSCSPLHDQDRGACGAEECGDRTRLRDHSSACCSSLRDTCSKECPTVHGTMTHRTVTSKDSTIAHCSSLQRGVGNKDSALSHGSATLKCTTTKDGATNHGTLSGDHTSCASRCLCSCHCASSATSSSDAMMTTPPSSPQKSHSLFGTLRKKFSQMMKRETPDQRVDGIRASPRAKSTDRTSSSRTSGATRSRTLPRKPSTACSSGPLTPAGSSATDCNFETFDVHRGRSFRRSRTRTPDASSPTSPCATLSPSRLHRFVGCPFRHDGGSGLRVSQETPAPRKQISANLLDNGEDKLSMAVGPDTGYGHTSAPTALDSASGNDQDGAIALGTVVPYYDQVKDTVLGSGPGWSLTRELFKLPKYGWYWGPIARSEAEERLAGQPDGAFLLRDSSDDRYLLSLSFRSDGRTLHTRIEHCNGLFSFYAQPESEGYSSVVDLIERSMSDSQSGVFCYSRARAPGSPSFPVRLARPVSRFTQVRSLQYLCRFVIRQHTRVDYIQKLPLPTSIKGWLEETQY